MSGKLNKLQAYIDNKIGEIRKLNDQLRLVQLEMDQAEKEKENLKQLMDDLGWQKHAWIAQCQQYSISELAT